MMFNVYYNKKVRELCHGVKVNDHMAIKEMADYFINLGIVNKNTVIVPAPQHIGYAQYTKEIAEIVADETKALVKDVLRCKPHDGMYQMKRKGRVKVPEFYLTELIEGNEIYFLDNVIATGTTYREAKKLIKNIQPLIYAADV